MSNQSPPSGSSNDLFEQFTVPGLDEWREEVERLLKGAPFARKMFSETLEGITVGPMYTSVETADLPWQENLPGQWPFLRGGRAERNAWLVAQELPLPTTEEFNLALQSDLNRGQTAVNLVLDQASRRGLDPDQAPADLVGSDGTSLAAMAELETALDGVDLAEIPLFIQAGTASLPVAAMLVSLLGKQGTNTTRLQGCLGCDPVCELAEKGKLSLEISRVYDELAVITRWAAEHAPKLKTLPVHESPWHDGGADGALSLALTLAAAVHTLRAMEERGVDLSVAASRVQFHLCIGSDFFMEMAKVRALRVLWSDVLAAAGCGESAAQVRIHARTSRRTQSKLDRQVNMLRVTTQAMSAVLGGVNSLHVSPFDEVDSIPDEFSRRIARNVQLILANECHFDQVQDPAGGSWYVEKLTADLAEKTWSIFQEIEAGGGIIEGLKTGGVQDRVAAAARVRCDRLATRRDVLVGTNQYANPAEPLAKPRTVDHAQLQARRTDDMARLRTSGEHEDHLLVLGRLEKIMDAGQEGLLNLLADAAAHGATLGELTGILRHDTATDLEVQFIALRRDAEPFEKLRLEVELLKDRGRVFVACLGDVARYMPRLEFTRRFFKVAGFTLVEEGFFTSADQAVQAAAESAAPVVVLTGLDTTYDEMAAPVLAGIKARSPVPVVILAGGTAELISELEQAGLDRSINARSNLLEILGQVAVGLGVQS